MDSITCVLCVVVVIGSVIVFVVSIRPKAKITAELKSPIREGRITIE